MLSRGSSEGRVLISTWATTRSPSPPSDAASLRWPRRDHETAAADHAPLEVAPRRRRHEVTDIFVRCIAQLWNVRSLASKMDVATRIRSRERLMWWEPAGQPLSRRGRSAVPHHGGMECGFALSISHFELTGSFRYPPPTGLLEAQLITSGRWSTSQRLGTVTFWKWTSEVLTAKCSKCSLQQWCLLIPLTYKEKAVWLRKRFKQPQNAYYWLNQISYHYYRAKLHFWGMEFVYDKRRSK